jgi:hypothetical protein
MFIPTQKLNKLQPNAIRNSPNMAGQYLGIHFVSSSFTFSPAQRVLRASVPHSIQHKNLHSNPNFSLALRNYRKPITVIDVVV